MKSALEEVAALLQVYVDGLYHSDTQGLRQVFHPDAIYASASEGALRSMRMDEYFPMVDQRPSPASKGDARHDCILSIEFVGPVTAMAKLECAILPKHFTDLLTLVKVDGRWQIIAKVFHVQWLDDGRSA